MCLSVYFFLFVGALWTRTTNNPDVSIGPLACPFAHLLCTDCFACARSFASCSLRSHPRLWESELLMSQNDLALSHGGFGSENKQINISRCEQDFKFAAVSCFSSSFLLFFFTFTIQKKYPSNPPTFLWVNGTSERANGRVSGQVLLSVFLVVLAHSIIETSTAGVNQMRLLHRHSFHH